MSTTSLSRPTSYDLASAHHIGPKHATHATDASDLKIPSNREFDSTQSLARALEGANNSNASHKHSPARSFRSPSHDPYHHHLPPPQPSPTHHHHIKPHHAEDPTPLPTLPKMRHAETYSAPSTPARHPIEHPEPRKSPQMRHAEKYEVPVESPIRHVEPYEYDPPFKMSPTRMAASRSHSPVPEFNVEEYKKSLHEILNLEQKVGTLEFSKEILQHDTTRLSQRNARLELETAHQAKSLAALQQEHTEVVDRLRLENSELVEKMDMIERVEANYVKVPSEDWIKLQQKIKILITENDVLVEENKTRAEGIQQLSQIIEQQSEEITSLRTTETSLESKIAELTESTISVESQLEAANSHATTLHENLASANNETARLDSELAHARETIVSEQTRFAALKVALDQVTEQYKEHVEESEEGARHLSNTITETKTESTTLQSNLTHLQHLLQTLEKRNQDLLASESTHSHHLSLATEKAHEAFLERDKAALREHQAVEEVKRLEGKYRETAEKWKGKAEAEIATMRAQHLQDRKKLGDEIAHLESKVSQSHAQAERSMREKRAAESELEKMMKHIPDEVERLNGIIEEVAGRLRAAEREKSDNLETLGTLQQKLTRDQNRHEKEKEELVFQVDDFYRRLRRAEKDLEDAKETAVKSMTHLTQLEHDTEKLNETTSQKLKQKESELHCIQQRHETELSELHSKLSSLSSTHTKTCQELHALTSTQHSLSSQWKHESASLTSRYDGIISDLRAQITRGHEKIKLLEEEIAEAGQSRKDVVLEVEAERRNTQKVKQVLKGVEDKCDAVTRRLDAVMKSEQEAVVEKKHLQRQIDRLCMERERLERERSYKENRESGSLRQAPTRSAHHVPSSDLDSQPDVRALQAEIERVKSRSRSAHHNIDAFLSTLEDGSDIVSE
ncbi:hypothetical protein HDU98_007528 [Podochytrium sp. JEL0797]|nr:hypothetical protein HDU98_007528 [Podochytrium sp. JEL0797]